MARYTIILTTHQRPKLLKRALLSIKMQSFCNISIIIVSDFACDETFEVVKPFIGNNAIFIERHGMNGPAESRNIGISLLKSDYAIFLDDDDELSTHFLAKADKILKHRQQTIYTDFLVSDDIMSGDDVIESSLHRVSLRGKRLDEIYIKNFIANSGIVYPVSVLKRARFDGILPLNEDWDFILNILKDNPLVYAPIDGPIVHKRVGRNGENRGSRNPDLLPHTFLKIYQKWPAPTDALKEGRLSLMGSVGLTVPMAAL